MKKIIISALMLMFGFAANAQEDVPQTELQAAIAQAQVANQSITEAFGPYIFGMKEKQFNKATKKAIKAKTALRNSIGNVEFTMYYADGRPYSLILANATFYEDKLCGLDFVYERFDAGISKIIMEEIVQADRLADMARFETHDGYIFLKDNLQVELSRGVMSYVNAPIVSSKAKENAEKNAKSRGAF